MLVLPPISIWVPFHVIKEGRPAVKKLMFAIPSSIVTPPIEFGKIVVNWI